MKKNLICYLPKAHVKYLAEEFETHNLNGWYMFPVVLSVLSQCPFQVDNWELLYFAFKFVTGTKIDSHPT